MKTKVPIFRIKKTISTLQQSIFISPSAQNVQKYSLLIECLVIVFCTLLLIKELIITNIYSSSIISQYSNQILGG